MTNHQCFCYSFIAIRNILKANLPITSDLFYNELYYLWDMYSEEAIERKYYELEEDGN